MRIVLDTNVLVAGLLNPTGACGRLLDLVLEGIVQPCVDGRILREYENVLRRQHLELPASPVADALDFLRHFGEYIAAVPLAASLPDPDDLPFLEVAAFAQADLVTGNLRHFPKRVCRPVRVITPAECLERLRRSPGSAAG